ncbi:MAG: minor capsid protein [Chloroflexi bacterium]|nr:minor capsid protein [Chloroflexota bacterium]
MTGTASTREVAGRTLVELGRDHPDLVVLGGDLNKSTFANLFGAAYPDRFFDFGPAEQNIVSIAAGMAASGKVSVVSTFAVFSTARPYDQLRVGVSQSNLNVKMVATHAGIITGEDGMSAHAIEDVALMCALPNMTVIVPADAVETAQVLRVVVERPGPFYVRLSRPATPVIHDNGFAFALGKAERVREGGDATVVACGIMVNTALEAAEALARLRVEVDANAQQGYRAEGLADRIRNEYGVSKSRASLIARQETSNFMANYIEASSRDAGIKKYQWYSARDSRTRPDHLALHGKIFSFDNPPITDTRTGARNNPMQDYRCRCRAKPVIS